MALAKERAAPESHMALLQAAASCSSFYGNVYGEASLDPSSTRFEFENYQKMVGNHEDEERSLESKTGVLKEFSVGHRLPPLSDPGITQYVINFKKGFENSGNVNFGSLLSFENGEPEPCPKMDQNDQEYSTWGDVEHGNYQYWNNHHLLHPSYGTDHSQLSDELSSLETTSHGDDGFGWLNSEGVATATECFQDSRNSDQANSHKRPHMGNEVSASKKHCPGGASLKKPKSKSIPSKDPQSVAAKNRRERISERLKTLQELVPNGSKVDLVTMLEKAISYVKFLQLQVKVLATDEFWPAQGGKAPEVSQVKEALDAILSSHKDRNSSSSK